MREISIEYVRASLKNGKRVLLLLRHAQRPRMCTSDTVLGMDVPITPHGVWQAMKIGLALRDLVDDVQFLSSPYLRTRMTCAAIREGMGISGAVNEITAGRTGWDWMDTDDRLGSNSFYIGDQQCLQKRLKEFAFSDIIINYLERGEGLGFSDLTKASIEFEGWLHSKFISRLGVFITHDWYCAALLTHFGICAKWNKDNWIHFCDGVCCVFDSIGRCDYTLFRGM